MTHTPGPWKVFIDDSGDQWTGWPLSIDAANDVDKSVVRQGGQWPYTWDAAMSQREAVANANLIASAPDLLQALTAAYSYITEVSRRMAANGLRPDYEELNALCDNIAATIAKAEGRP